MEKGYANDFAIKRSLTPSRRPWDNYYMKRLLIIMGVAILLMACSPVLNRGLMKQGIRDVQFNQLREAPDDSKGRLYILGGIIVDTRLTETGSQIEALFVPILRLPEGRGLRAGQIPGVDLNRGPDPSRIKTEGNYSRRVY
jgi:hypothetical protein